MLCWLATLSLREAICAAELGFWVTTLFVQQLPLITSPLSAGLMDQVLPENRNHQGVSARAAQLRGEIREYKGFPSSRYHLLGAHWPACKESGGKHKGEKLVPTLAAPEEARGIMCHGGELSPRIYRRPLQLRVEARLWASARSLHTLGPCCHSAELGSGNGAGLSVSLRALLGIGLTI